MTYNFNSRSGHLLLIAAVGILAYSNTFYAPFVFDDTSSIVGNRVIRNMANFLTNRTGYKYNPRRFVGYLSFAFNYWLGGVNVVGYHIFNLAVHLGAAMLVYCFCRLSFQTPFLRESRFARGSPLIALVAALLFVAHPLQTEAVTYVVQRLASLATLFYLAALVLYIKARLAQETEGEGFKKFILLYSLSLLFVVIAMKTKEIAFTLPITIMLYDFFFFPGPGPKRLFLFLPMALTLLIIPASLMDTGKPVGELLSDVSEHTRAAGWSLTRSNYLATQFRVIVTYVRLLFLPGRQNFDYDYPVYHSFFVPQVYLSFFFLAGLLCLGVYSYFKSSRKIPKAQNSHRQAKEPEQHSISPSETSTAELRLIAFGIFWFFITLAVESSIIPIADVIVEHRVYLPSVGACIAVALAGAILTRRFSFQTTISILVIVVGVLAALTWNRNAVYADEATLWRDSIAKSPGKPRPQSNLGYVLMARGQLNQAIEHFRTALRLNPAYEPAYNNLGYAFSTMGRADEAIEQFRKVLTLNPTNVDAHYNLGAALAKKGLSDQAVKEYVLALRLKPDDIGARNNLGIEYDKLGLVDEAIVEYQKVLALDPEYVEALYNLGVAFQQKRLFDQAVKQYQTALKLNPKYAEAHNNLAAIYGMAGLLDQAMNHIQAATRLQPGNPFFREHLAHVYDLMGLPEKANEERRIARTLTRDG
ncbi:MAG: tetratricopeptide repeat protein [Chloroflexota bacterium]